MAAVLFYKSAIRAVMIEKFTSTGSGYHEPLFNVIQAPSQLLQGPVARLNAIEEAVTVRDGDIRFFSNQLLNIGSQPDWFLNPFNGKKVPNRNLHWARLNDFNSEIGDIKCVWEPSRFGWALILSRGYRLTGDETYLNRLNEWASDWTDKNRLNTGPNWKCGQEAATRMKQTLLAAYLLQQHLSPNSGLVRFVWEHCSRIAKTIFYGIAQNNNHGTSEAAGLFIGGAWLFSCCQDNTRVRRKARRWHRLGRRWLEDRVRKLVALDGSFSQYSLNYHRVLLDTLNMVEFWRRELQLPEFSKIFYERTRAAVEWLFQMTDPDTGDGPNLGGNDGARLFVLSPTEYRDYRPSVQLAAVLFLGRRVYPTGPWDDSLFWLGLSKGNSLSPPYFRRRGAEVEKREIPYQARVAGLAQKFANKSKTWTLHEDPEMPRKVASVKPRDGGESGVIFEHGSRSEMRSANSRSTKLGKTNICKENGDLMLTRRSRILPEGGYVIMNFEKSKNWRSWGLIRFPRFRFRPSHADAFHLDLWCNGVNLLRDSGTYSYHTDEPWQSYFSGTAAHNTIQFDQRDQMPRLSRFLFGNWLRMETIGDLIENDGALSWTGSYVDFKKCRHQRCVSSDGVIWRIVDQVEGFNKEAVLRWRLVPGNWVSTGLKCAGKLAELSIVCDKSITRFEVVEGWESRHYMEKTKLPVLEVQVEPGMVELTTEIRLKI